MRPGRVIFLLAAIVAVALAVANRQIITVHFDPITDDPDLTLQMPLFVLAAVCVLTGILIGGLASLLTRRRRSRHDRRDRHARRAAAKSPSDRRSGP